MSPLIPGMGGGVGKTEIRFAFRAPEPAAINQPGRQIYIRIPTIDYAPIRRINYRFQIGKNNGRFTIKINGNAFSIPKLGISFNPS